MKQNIWIFAIHIGKTENRKRLHKHWNDIRLRLSDAFWIGAKDSIA